MTTDSKSWEFAIVGCNQSEIPKYLGFARTIDEALVFKGNMEVSSWSRVAVFDASLVEIKQQAAS
jgi:hypothetical protein